MMSTHSQCNYVNPNSISLDWECLIISKTDMLLDGVPKELINTWFRSKCYRAVLCS